MFFYISNNEIWELRQIRLKLCRVVVSKFDQTQDFYDKRLQVGKQNYENEILLLKIMAKQIRIANATSGGTRKAARTKT